ncbi:MAG: hypothetical protein ACHQX4_06830 [Gemmatimonadales bacterium]
MTTHVERLAALHERLCFARAFPRSAAELRRALRGLARFERLARPVKDELENTGIAGTLVRYPFNYRMAQWLLARHGRAITIDWRAYKRHEWDEVAAALSLVVAWAENEGLDDDDVPSWDWIAWAKRGDRRSDLAWLIAMLQRRGLEPEVERHIYESLDLPLIWDLAGCRDAVTAARLPVGRVFYTRALLQGRPADFAGDVRAPAAALELLRPSRADRIIDAARAALSQREREFHVIVHANREETYRFDAGRGLEIYVFGLDRRLRLTLEADYGALLVKNGVPIGYGLAVLLFDRADIAINVFETYRAGESPFIFSRFAALFHHHFGAEKLVMRRYQVGWQNPEGIETGSFWFYYRLGFRPIDQRVRELAAGESARLARRRGARSNPEMLRRLSRSDMVLCLDGTPVERFRDVAVRSVGLAVTRLIERRFDGDRRRALETLGARVSRALGARVHGRLVPVVALIPDLARWPAADRRQLAAVVLAKEARREGPYVRALRRAGAFRQFLVRRLRA